MEHEHEIEEHDLGLAHDLSTLMHRRRAMAVMAGAGVLALVGCGTAATDATSSTTTGSGATTSTAAAAVAADSCTEIPVETAGPFPGDGTNGPDALAENGIVRSDITTSFGSSSGTAQGIPATVTLTVTDLANGCNPLAGAAVYLWHCDREGEYSMYGNEIADQNYLRGVQETDSNGVVAFGTIFPAAYDGRWPHMHFEVFPSLSAATSGGDRITTSQLALPSEAASLVYATEGYEQSVSNLARTSLSRDGVFSDGWQTQVATVTGDVSSGFTIALTVPVDSSTTQSAAAGGAMGSPGGGGRP